ncbi:MAG: 2-oxoglutarate dehydrogenase, E2 component, dihydrolipoamide succinyltransferase [Propionibacteriaceae bacterium]|nr:2-oxoglutarate dehydrogenase, E2 component, dihydrolipoamide succinyltransferase [Propionibacteriaceae bacterium]
MSTEVILPTLGESVNEATISRWLKEVGEHVDADEALLEVSTDKVDTEVPSPTSGTLLEIRFKEDDTAPVGAVLAIIGEPSEATPAPATPAAPAPAAPAETPAPPAPAPAAAAPAAGTEVILPNLGESVNEATISRWLKEVGEHVDADEALLEVSTDKVDTEVPSPTSGTLLEIRFKEDDTAPVGAVLAIIGEPSEATPAPATPAAPAPAAPAETPAPPAPAPAAAAPAAPRATLPEFEGYVTPLVRKLARDNGIDLATVTGTGVGGRIRKQDVEDAIEAQKAAAAAQQAAAAAPAPAAEKAPSPEAAKKGTTEKMTKLRSIVATRMRESLQVSAQLTATVEVDLSAVTRVRAKAKDEFRKREGVGLTYLAFITKAATEALRDFPKVNASIDSEAGTITYHESEDIGIAVDTPRGLLVPVIRGAGDLNVGGIAKKIGDVAARARDNKIGPDELSGATFTITNYGSTGTLFDTPIINQPNVAILGTGAMVKRPVVVTDGFGNDTIAIRPMMYLSLTYDHRLVDGADASRFLSAVKARLEAGDFGGEFGQAQ